MTLQELAELVGVSQPTLSNLENGSRRASTVLAAALARALGVSEVWLVEGREPMYEETLVDDDRSLAERTVEAIIESAGMELATTERDDLIRRELEHIKNLRDSILKRPSSSKGARAQKTNINQSGTAIVRESSTVYGSVVGHDLITTNRHTTRVTNTPPPGSINESQARQIHTLITRVGELESQRSGPRGYGIVMNQFKRKYGITSYKNLSTDQFEQAVEDLKKRSKVLERDLLSRGYNPISRDDFIRRIQSICRTELRWTDPIRRAKMLEQYGKSSLKDLTMAQLEAFYDYVLGAKRTAKRKEK